MVCSLGVRPPPPSPSRIRPATSKPRLGVIPHRSEPRLKSATQAHVEVLAVDHGRQPASHSGQDRSRSRRGRRSGPRSPRPRRPQPTGDAGQCHGGDARVQKSSRMSPSAPPRPRPRVGAQIAGANLPGREPDLFTAQPGPFLIGSLIGAFSAKVPDRVQVSPTRLARARHGARREPVTPKSSPRKSH